MLVGSLLLRWMFSRDAGLIGAALGPFGMGDATIPADPQLAMAALIFNAVWRDSAFAMILLLAGLKSIPPEPMPRRASTAPVPSTVSGASRCR